MARHILLIEDNVADIFLVKQALQYYQIEHELTVTEDGDEALRLIESSYSGASAQRQPELILLDLNLPRQDGLTVLRRLRALAEGHNANVVVLTSSDAKQDREGAAKLGATYFRKPFDLDDFMQLGALVKKLLAATPGDEFGTETTNTLHPLS